MTKPVVLVDQDGPLADFDALFFERCGVNGWTIDVELHEQVHRYATDHIPDKQHRSAARRMVETSGWFADLPVVDGAVDGLADLAERAEVWLCTKPLEANKTCRDEKAAWVVRHFGEEWERRLIITPDKSMVRGDVLLDDAPSLDWFERASWRTVIFPAPWNGEGSQWHGHDRWAWGDPVERLLGL